MKLQQAAQTPDSTTGVTPSSTSNSTLVISKTLKPNATKSSSSDNKGTSEADKQAAGERRRNKSKMNGFATGSSDSSIDGTTWRVSTDKKATAGGGESDPSI